MSSNIEIEKKFLIDIKKVPTNFFTDYVPLILVQTYLVSDNSSEKRVRMTYDPTTKSTTFTRTTKSKKTGNGLIRQEYEEEIDQTTYNKAITEQMAPNTHQIKKLRYRISNLKYEIDIYQEELSSLAILEIEFDSEQEANSFNARDLDWIIKEVTDDKSFSNAELAKKVVSKNKNRNFSHDF